LEDWKKKIKLYYLDFVLFFFLLGAYCFHKGHGTRFHHVFVLCVNTQRYYKWFSTAGNRRMQRVDSSGDFGNVAAWELSSGWM